MIELKFKWVVWLFVALAIVMLYEGPRDVVTLVVGVLRAFYHLAGSLDKGLHGSETCGRACQR